MARGAGAGRGAARPAGGKGRRPASPGGGRVRPPPSPPPRRAPPRLTLEGAGPKGPSVDCAETCPDPDCGVLGLRFQSTLA
ncbi:unnamed protein product [Rangifer tarandus platyrhynchus]|uniref:Uncharacterized protein n=2 Tax=Rangifer tarandus platyrhynchus TaxID=3082113 RepID=A0ACB0DZA3_RANTA|nr:unnamed protein product [Rangifer tarandus platyrhynchus]CAI9693554.1 unnamed protein product [Rangifer tarandus platyrhynchus]